MLAMRFVRRNSSMSPRECGEVKVSSTEKILKGREAFVPELSTKVFSLLLLHRDQSSWTQHRYAWYGVATVTPKYVDSAGA